MNVVLVEQCRPRDWTRFSLQDKQPDFFQDNSGAAPKDNVVVKVVQKQGTLFAEIAANEAL